MKRIVLFLLVISCAGFIFAQDIIVTKAGTNIEDVTVKSITNTEIVYILNGTETTLPRSEAAAILYSDGRYEEIKTPSTAIITEESAGVGSIEDNSEAKLLEQERKLREAEEKRRLQEQKKREAEEKRLAQEAAKAEAKAAAAEKARIEAEEARLAKERERQDGQIHRLACNKYYFVDRTYTKKDIQSVVFSCPEAKAKYDNGHKLMVAGWSTFGAATGVLIAGSIMTPLGEGNRSDGLLVGGLVGLIVGPIVMAGGLTIACVGHYRMDHAYKVYNKSCAAQKEPVLSMNLGVTRNGIGLTIHF